MPIQQHPIIANVLWDIRSRIGCSPTWFPLIYGLGFRARERWVKDITELVIDGFPRSTNSYSVVAFEHAVRPRSVLIAHHLHVPAVLIQGIRMNKPTCLLLRDPEGAVKSHIMRRPKISAANLLRSYIRFHRPLLVYKERMLIASFDTVVSDFPKIIEAINSRFGTDFPCNWDEHSVATCHAIQKQRAQRWKDAPEHKVGVPTPEKEHLRTRIDLTTWQPLLDEAKRLHATLLPFSI